MGDLGALILVVAVVTLVAFPYLLPYWVALQAPAGPSRD